jgi:hypothetical protein
MELRMQTFLAVFALAGGIASGNIPAQPKWQADYFDARARAIDDKRPLAVFIGSAKNDWPKGVRDATDLRVAQLLREQYVCVLVDTDTASGKQLANQFAVSGKGLVISDRSGNSQQFHHSGDVSRDDLVKALQRYSDTNRPFRATETLAQLSPPPTPAYSYSPTFRLSGG